MSKHNIHKSKFPYECPNCKMGTLDYGDFNWNSRSKTLSQEITCNYCNKEYLEIFKVVGWKYV